MTLISIRYPIHCVFLEKRKKMVLSDVHNLDAPVIENISQPSQQLSLET